jgi:hypothetical protein
VYRACCRLSTPKEHISQTGRHVRFIPTHAPQQKQYSITSFLLHQDNDSLRIRCNHPPTASVGWQPTLETIGCRRFVMRKQLLAGAVVAALATCMTTSAMAFDRGGAGGFHCGGRHGHSHGFHAGHSGFHGAYAGMRRGGFRHGWHYGWSDRRVVGGRGGWGYGPSYDGAYYEGVAPFGRMVGRPAAGGSTFFVGL